MIIATQHELEALPRGCVLKTIIGGTPSGRTWAHMNGNWYGAGLEWGVEEPSLPALVIYHPN